MSRLDDLDHLLDGQLPPERPERPSIGRQIWRVVKWTLIIFVGLLVFAFWLLTRTNPGDSLYNIVIGGGIGFLVMLLYREWDQYTRNTEEKLRVIDRKVTEIRDILRRIGR